MSDWQDRVIEEKVELDEKIVKLTSFIFSQKPGVPIDLDMTGVLTTQLNAMQDYSRVLLIRISMFK